MKYPPATHESIINAYRKSSRRFIEEGLLASESSAGFTFPAGSRRHGFQVFVRVARFDAALLKDQPETGGLVVNKKEPLSD